MVELENKFQFLINKFENNTYYISEIVQNSTNKIPIGDQAAHAYDSYGAAKYIIVVVLVYGFSIIFFIGSQVRSTQKVSDEVDEVNAEKILRSMETEIFTREVLEKLSDKEHREKAWNIYRQGKIRRASSSAPILQSTEKEKELEEADRDAVENIQKKLKILNKVQSGYKGQDKGYEIETVNEVFKFNKKRKTSSIHDTNDVNDQNINIINKKKTFFQRFKINKQKNNSLTSNLTQQKTPLLVLQTDADGLSKLKEAHKNKHLSKSNQNINNVQLSSTTFLDEQIKSTKNSTELTSEVNNKRRSTSVAFDHCEISEQITTV